MTEEPTFSRDEVATIAEAVEEFRDEYAGPHLDANRELVERIAAERDQFQRDLLELREGVEDAVAEEGYRRGCRFPLIEAALGSAGEGSQ